MDKDELQVEIFGSRAFTPAEHKSVRDMAVELQAGDKVFATGGYINVPLWEDEEELDANR